MAALVFLGFCLLIPVHPAVAQTATAGFGSNTESVSASLRRNGGHRVIPQEERLLLGALEAIGVADLDQAEYTLRRVLKRQPDFRLARLVYADVLMARSGRLVNFASGAAGRHVQVLREEALARLANVRNFPDQAHKLPSMLVRLAPSQPRIIVVDLSAARFYLYRNEAGTPHLESSFYVSTGKNGGLKRLEGDQRTPVGVYFVTGRIAANALSDFYGPGALPVDYPNEWDLLQGHTGYGIWIHGVPSDTYARAPKASDGCMALSNDNLEQLLNLSQLKNTPVIISNNIEWLDRKTVKLHRQSFDRQLNAWRKDWESRDVARYARHYSRNFRTAGTDYSGWIKRKHRVNAAKTYIRIALQDVSIFTYPGEKDLRVVSFTQDYQSNNHNGQSTKRQYWQRESDGVWRIIYEGSIRIRPEHLRGIPYSARSRLSRLAQ